MEGIRVKEMSKRKPLSQVMNRPSDYAPVDVAPPQPLFSKKEMPAEPLEQLNFKVTKALKAKIKVKVAKTGVKLQDALRDLLEDWVSK